jgi:hypothetical protein
MLLWTFSVKNWKDLSFPRFDPLLEFANKVD